jgi:ATPase-IB1_Cu: copper-translocating P-type ATPase
VPM